MTNEPQTAPPPTGPNLPELQDAMRLEALGLMTAGIVHDLGNMVQVLASAVSLIERHPQVSVIEGLQPVIAGATSALDRTGALVRQIVGFARDDQAREELVDVPLCLAGLERLLRWICPEGVELTVAVAVDLPLLVCSRRNLENAILNLVLNACDATPAGGAITVRGQTAQDTIVGDCILLSVTDTGVGMAAETIQRAFEPFFTTKLGTGNGLGLAMVRRFAQEIGGYAEIESTIGQGTTVVLRLPTLRFRSP
jgi:signal transduction histidine kinase